MKIKNQILKIINNFGYNLIKLYRSSALVNDGHSDLLLKFIEEASKIPGMVPVERCVYLYFLAYSSNLNGDIIEIGSWQGRTTSFLAKACKDSQNGVVYAIDHFQGNPSNKKGYIVTNKDLSDLKTNFNANIKSLELDDYVNLLDMKSEEAVQLFVNNPKPIRLLFIDGDHSYEGCLNDIKNFIDFIMPGGIIVFDDYSNAFPGVLKAVKEKIFNTNLYFSPIQYTSTLVIKKK